MSKNKSKKLPDNQIAVYHTADGKINIEVLYANENIWLSQKRMAELFDCTPDNISLHLKNIYMEKELDERATAEDFSVVQKEVNRGHEVAQALALREYETFKKIQDHLYESDFDKLLKKLEKPDA